MQMQPCSGRMQLLSPLLQDIMQPFLFFVFLGRTLSQRNGPTFFLLGNQGALHARMHLLHSLFQCIFLREHRSESK
jgi:hypothetical protein